MLRSVPSRLFAAGEVNECSLPCISQVDPADGITAIELGQERANQGTYRFPDFRFYSRLSQRMPDRLHGRIASTAAVLCLALLGLGTAVAQMTGSVSGVVENSGRPVSGARVALVLPGRVRSITETIRDGSFSFDRVSPGVYDLRVSAEGFSSVTVPGVKIDPGVETPLASIRLSISENSAPSGLDEETLTNEVTAAVNEDWSSLPLAHGSERALLETLPAVTDNGRAAAVYGESPSVINIAFDGVNIEQNLTRPGSLPPLALPLHEDQVSEVTIATGTISGCGCSQILLSSPRGGAQAGNYHGSAYWLGVPSATAAQSWFDHSQNTPAMTNFNQFGVSFGGPLVAKRLSVFANYEMNLDRSRVTRTGADLTGPVASQDPLMRGVLALIPQSSSGIYRGTQQNYDTTQVQLLRLDYGISAREALELMVAGAQGSMDLPSESSVFGLKPDATGALRSRFYSGTWRSTIGPRLVNQAQGGASIEDLDFRNSVRARFGFVAILADPAIDVSQPMAGIDSQGHSNLLHSYQDNLMWLIGRHSIQFGAWVQQFRFNTYGSNYGLLDSVTVPVLTIGDIAQGAVSEMDQRFNITSPASGYSSGSTPQSKLSMNIISGYIHDSWKLARSLTIIMGLRYDYIAPVNEHTGTAILPVLHGEPSNAVYDQNLGFAFSSTQQPLYGHDLDNDSPYLGAAWQPLRTPPLVVRGGFSITYVPDNLLENMSFYSLRNPFQSFEVALDSPGGKLSQAKAVPAPALPSMLTLQTLLSFANRYGQAPGPVLAIDPEVRTPNVQYWDFGIETHALGFAWDLRYLGNYLEEGPRAVDRNQVQLPAAFLATFKQVQSALASGAPTTGFPLLPGGGLCSNFTFTNCRPDLYAISLIETGQAGELARWYQAAGYGPDAQAGYYSLGNPLAPGGIDLLSKLGDSRFDGLQFTASRRVANLTLLASYVFSKTMSNLDDYQPGAIDPALSLHDSSIEWAPSPFNIAQVFKLNWSWKIPAFQAENWHGWPEKLLRNWRLGGITTVQTGAPFSLLSGGYVTAPDGQVSLASGLGTLFSAADSGENTVATALTGTQIRKSFGIRENPDGTVSYVNAAAGAFAEPAAGTVGNLPRRMFTGPAVFNLDVALQKTMQLNERWRVETRIDAIDAFNHPNWLVGDQTLIGSVNQLAAFNNNVTQMNAPRSIQIAARLTF